MRRLVIMFAVLGTLAAVMSVAPPAGAQPTLDEVLRDIDEFGYYVEPGVQVDFDELDAAIGDTGGEVVLVLLLDDDPAALGQLQAELGTDRFIIVEGETVEGELVLHADGDGASEADIEDALAAYEQIIDRNGSYGDALRAFDASVRGAVVATPTVGSGTDGVPASNDEDSGGGGGAGILIFLLVVAVLVIGGVWFVRQRAKKVDTGEVERARAEIRSQLEIVAAAILDQEGAVEVRGPEQAVAYFREANATYTEVSEAVEETTNLLELAELADDVDEARWQLEAAEALMDGRPVPPEPEDDKPVACFFDPTHKPGSEDATLRTPAGDKEVRVCGSCADKLARGEQPEPRMIDVGGKRVPAAKAPRSHGGLGMGGLSMFEVILGGLGALARSGGNAGPASRGPVVGGAGSGSGVGIDWSARRPGTATRRPPGNVFGPSSTPDRPRSLPRTPASRPPRRPVRRTRAVGRGNNRRRR